jgi:hypothetical protein
MSQAAKWLVVGLAGAGALGLGLIATLVCLWPDSEHAAQVSWSSRLDQSDQLTWQRLCRENAQAPYVVFILSGGRWRSYSRLRPAWSRAQTRIYQVSGDDLGYGEASLASATALAERVLRRHHEQRINYSYEDLPVYRCAVVVNVYQGPAPRPLRWLYHDGQQIRTAAEPPVASWRHTLLDYLADLVHLS